MRIGGYRRFVRWSVVSALSVCVVLTSSGTGRAAAGEPIPGVDISLEQIPGGISVGPAEPSKGDGGAMGAVVKKLACVGKLISKAQKTGINVSNAGLTKCQEKFSASCAKAQTHYTGGMVAAMPSCDVIDVEANRCMRAIVRPCVGTCTGGTNDGTACAAPSDCPGGLCASDAGEYCQVMLAYRAAGEPIPGVDISLEQIPGGISVGPAEPSKGDGGITNAAIKKLACVGKLVSKAQTTGINVDNEGLTKCQERFSASCAKAQLCMVNVMPSCDVVDVELNRCLRAIVRPCVGTCTGGTNDGTACTATSDCPGGLCASDAGEYCQPTCTNGTLDPDETDVDCGGNAGCPRCATGQVCDVDTDCQSSDACTGNVCQTVIAACEGSAPQCNGTCSPGEVCEAGEGYCSDSGDSCAVDADCPSGETCTIECACAIVPVCGNGTREEGEECDIGSANGGLPSLCDSACQLGAVTNLSAAAIRAAESCPGPSIPSPNTVTSAGVPGCEPIVQPSLYQFDDQSGVGMFSAALVAGGTDAVFEATLNGVLDSDGSTPISSASGWRARWTLRVTLLDSLGSGPDATLENIVVEGPATLGSPGDLQATVNIDSAIPGALAAYGRRNIEVLNAEVVDPDDKPFAVIGWLAGGPPLAADAPAEANVVVSPLARAYAPCAAPDLPVVFGQDACTPAVESPYVLASDGQASFAAEVIGSDVRFSAAVDGALESDGVTPSNDSGWNLAMLWRFSMNEASNGDMTVIDFPIQLSFPAFSSGRGLMVTTINEVMTTLFGSFPPLAAELTVVDETPMIDDPGSGIFARFGLRSGG